MTETLTTRDGLIGNSPRYIGYTSPTYQRYLKDDSGAAINLTGIALSAFRLVMLNQSNPLLIKVCGGTFSTINATQGLISYTYTQHDLADAGMWYLFLTVQLPGELTPRAFDPDLLSIINAFPGGATVTIQQVDLEQLSGNPLSSSNPVPISGPVSIADGANVSQGATTDNSSANTQIGLLKAIKGYLAGAGTALTPYVSNPVQTAAAGVDTLYKLGAGGTTSFSHVSGQNNTASNVYLAFDQSTTISGNQVYVLAPGQAYAFDRAGTVLHFSSPAQQSFGGQSGITVEAFA